MPSRDARPSPESFLPAARAEAEDARGKLKIFLGASPGVGKTYAMLEEAHLHQKAGADVVVALVETHGRSETARLLSHLEQLPRRQVAYRGQSVSELDLDGLLARRPTLALIDELAHTNAPGSRHPKRWQDVLEVLDAGIDVLTTLNIQHIESLNDSVAAITGVRVRETVPDAVLARAGAIELIDLPPEDLIKRLHEGKVYLPETAGRAMENFFTKGKLTALREMALRATAGHVDAEMLAHMRDHAVEGPWPTHDRLLVCVNESPVSKALVRTAKRMADRAKIPWIAMTVATPGHDAMPESSRAITQDALRLAETLGAEAIKLRTGADVAKEILAFARARNVTRLLIGRARWPHDWFSRLRSVVREPVSERLLSEAAGLEITIVTPDDNAPRTPPAAAARTAPDWSAWSGALLAAIFALVPATSIAWALYSVLPVASLAVVYLVAVLVVAFRNGLPGALSGSVLGFLAFNFFFTRPYYSFQVDQFDELAALAVFLVSSAFTGWLASRLHAQVESLRAAQSRTETLYGFARTIAASSNADAVLAAAADHCARALNADTLILTAGPRGLLEQVHGSPAADVTLDPAAIGAARWAFEKGEAAGAKTGTLPNSDWLFVPLATAAKPFGVIGVKFHDPARAADPETRRLLLAVEDQVAVAVERSRLADTVSSARVAAESDKLRAALLNSVSHDLRTPLVSIIGATSVLAVGETVLTGADAKTLAQTALEEARRLDRYVQNLLDMTRLGHGALKPKAIPADVREIVGRVRDDLKRVLAGHDVVVDVPRDAPLLQIDPVLIGQALSNLLENAAKYASPGTTITIRLEQRPGQAVLSVADQGPGVLTSERDKIFDIFHRAERGDAVPSGTGLGLAIVKGMVEAHGGLVRVIDGPSGRGACFEMTLPLPEAASRGTESAT
jgi:two-component system, OmpR family, sensor histidine kinase KdpD